MRNLLLAIVILLLAASAVLAQSSVAPKPDRPKNSEKPLPPKRSGNGTACAAYGPGFVKLEGTDTCVRIGGSIDVGAGGSSRR
jgi:Porin subfamily